MTTTGAAPCSNTASTVNITVGSPLFCPGMDNGSLSFNPGSGSGSDSYQISVDGGTTWNPYTAGSSVNTDNATGNIVVRTTRADANCTNTSSNYTLWTLDATCCRAPTTVTASLGNSSLCSGNGASLNFTSLAGGHNPAGSHWEYQWEQLTPSDSVISAWSTTQNVTTGTLSAGTYTYILKVRASSCNSTFTTSNTVTETVVNCLPPVITSFSPTTVCANSGTTITITGSALLLTTGVTVSGVSATFTVIDDSHVSITLPSAVTYSGSGDIVVTNSIGSFDSGTIPQLLTVNSIAIAGTFQYTNGSALSICSGSTISCSNVTAPTNGGTGTLSVVWYCGSLLAGQTAGSSEASYGNFVESTLGNVSGTTSSTNINAAAGGGTGMSPSLSNYNPLLDFPGVTYVCIIRRAYTNNCGIGVGGYQDQYFYITLLLPTVNAGSSISSICQSGTSVGLGGSVGGTATGGIWTDGGAGGTFTPNATTLNATLEMKGWTELIILNLQ